MGKFSEAASITTAKHLEAIILDAMNGEDWFNNRTVIVSFVKKHLYKMYKTECGDAWINLNSEIDKEFGNK